MRKAQKKRGENHCRHEVGKHCVTVLIARFIRVNPQGEHSTKRQRQQPTDAASEGESWVPSDDPKYHPSSPSAHLPLRANEKRQPA